MMTLRDFKVIKDVVSSDTIIFAKNFLEAVAL